MVGVATLILGCIVAADGQEFGWSDLRIKVLHTGSLMKAPPIFSRTLRGRINYDLQPCPHGFRWWGRPDLAQKRPTWRRKNWPDSYMKAWWIKIMPLADDVIIISCMGQEVPVVKYDKETVDSLGNQKRMNYAMNQPGKAFIKAVTEGLTPPPAYFGFNVPWMKGDTKVWKKCSTMGYVHSVPVSLKRREKYRCPCARHAGQ